MKVNEIFGPTIQGEGKSAGMPCMFLRLAVCNLACIWCDTPHTWNWTGTKFLHPEKYDRRKEIRDMTCHQIVSELRKKSSDTQNLVISGGEPMLQQYALVELLKILKKKGYWVEIETNGTIEPEDQFLELIDQINCSPKTSNSGPDNRPEMREKPSALQKLVSSPKTNFKFVVECGADIHEINDLVEKYDIGKERVYLMLQAKDRDEYFARFNMVENLARENGYLFSQRYQIELWNRKRGV